MKLNPYSVEAYVVRKRNFIDFLWRRKDSRKVRKFFVIGHPRAGTTSLHRFFQNAGLKSCHTASYWRTAEFDCFSDRGNFQPFRAYDRYYENARFILNTRPLENWLISCFTHKRRFMWVSSLLRIIELRNRYFMEVLKYFTGRTNLHIVNIERSGAFDYLSCRLNLIRFEKTVHNRSLRPPNPKDLVKIARAFRRLGIEGEKSCPFVVPSLLSPGERRIYSRFLKAQADYVFI